ncbi:unnamed protein product [Meloidogyne enterolobii]|uniref:Uncharacterized protein n=1 Tax=Meloidogyne enterolobii TaxID=390850 RepID=A0ACB0Y673_MELEN
METRYLIPPKLNNSNLGDKIVGYRPCRHGPPRMEIEKKNYKGKIKIIGHNYGHAGSASDRENVKCKYKKFNLDF